MRRAVKKRWLPPVLCLMLAVILPSARALATDEFGDLNGDGQVTAADAAALLRSMDAPGEVRFAAMEKGDLTQNGLVNDVDVKAWLSVSAGLIPDIVSFAERISSGLCPETEFSRFRYTGTASTRNAYQSDNVSMEITKHAENGVTYYIADIYIQDITCFRTAFADGQYEGDYKYTTTVASAVNAIVAINGDFYDNQSFGPTIRNGHIYRRGVYEEWDSAILSCDGVFHTYGKHELTRESLAEMNVFQSWMFGPLLLDAEGRAMESFNSHLGAKNPRAAIGYYAPGHYCFVLVDGRQKRYSNGMTFSELAALFESLGCRSAYNLDGGQTAMMATATALINQPYKDGRPVSDIVYIAEPML